MKFPHALVLLAPFLVGSAGAGEDDHVWSNADLLRLFGAPAEETDVADDGTARDDAASWELVESFIERRYRLEEQRREPPERQREEPAEPTRPVFAIGLPWYRYPHPGVPRPPRHPIRPRPPQPRRPDHTMESPSPRLDRTVDRINARRQSIEQSYRPDTPAQGAGREPGDGGQIPFSGGARGDSPR